MEDWTNEEWMGRGGGRNKRRVEGWQTIERSTISPTKVFVFLDEIFETFSNNEECN